MNLLEKYRAKLTSMKQDEERRFRFEERAAIIEYDGGLTREEAERLARASLVNRVN